MALCGRAELERRILWFCHCQRFSPTADFHFWIQLTFNYDISWDEQFDVFASLKLLPCCLLFMEKRHRYCMLNWIDFKSSPGCITRQYTMWWNYIINSYICIQIHNQTLTHTGHAETKVTVFFLHCVPVRIACSYLHIYYYIQLYWDLVIIQSALVIRTGRLLIM